MLYIRCSAPLGRGRSGGRKTNSSSPSKGTRKSSSLPRPLSPGPAPKEQPQQPQRQQRSEYHNITENWNVRRARLEDFPETAQQVIIEGKGRQKTKKNTTLKAAVPPNRESPLQANCAKVLEVLKYETRMGLLDFTGRSGEKFSQWMLHTLGTLRDDLTTAGHPILAEHCLGLEQAIMGYDHLIEGSAQRAAVVEHLASEITRIGHDIQLHPHRMRSDRYSSITTGLGGEQRKDDVRSVVDVDAAAAEAHAEETAMEGSSSLVDSSSGIDVTASSVSGGEQQVIEDGYVMVGNRRIKAETVAFRQSFLRAAVQNVASNNSSVGDLGSSGEQRTREWLQLRERRLTASAFSKALGFFAGDRESLWEEKVGLAVPFSGNEATAWGTTMEPYALSTFEELTGQRVESCMFRVKHDDPPHGWLGASPDGLIQGLTITNNIESGGDNKSEMMMTNDYLTEGGLIMPSLHASGFTNSSSSSFSAAALGSGPGILEIKCPFNKGRPELAVPPSRAIWYYMPQMQGLMDIFDRQWCSLYIWTQSHGSAAFRVERNREYWNAAFEVLAEFWWAHVVPARQAHDAGASREEIEAYRPSPTHPNAERMKQWSKQLADQAPGTFYNSELAPMLPPQPQKKYWRR